MPQVVSPACFSTEAVSRTRACCPKTLRPPRMSSISFPMEQSGSASGSSRDDQLFASHFSTSSSFQMNPLSSHPPRSPHVSLISSASSSRPQHTNFTGDIYSDGLDPVAVEVASTSVEDMDPEEERVKSAEDNVKVAEIWREMILTSNGRDKSFVRLFVPPCSVLRPP